MKELIDTTMEEQLSTTIERPSKLAKLDADECTICIHHLTWLESSDDNSFLMILHQIHSLLMQNKASDQSLCSLCRVLTLRLGYLLGSNAPNVPKIVSLSFQCLQYCFRTTSLMDPSETMITFRMVVQLLDSFVGQTDDLVRNALDLFQIWLSKETSGRVAWRKCLTKDRSTLEEMMVVLIKISSSRKHPVMAVEIQDFLRRHNRGHGDAHALFEIALQVLDERSVPNIYTYQEDDQLFLIRCLALMENRQPSTEQLDSIISLLDSPTDTAIRAMQVLKSCSQYLSDSQRDNCIPTMMECVMNLDISESTLLPALDYLEALLIHHPSTPISMAEIEELLDLCSSWIMGEPAFHSPLQTRASSIALLLVDRSMHQLQTQTKKHRFVRILAQLLLSCQSIDLISRAVSLSCEWIDDIDMRNEILPILPNLVNSLAHLIIMDRVTTSDTRTIVQAISSMVQFQPSVLERSLPKLLDAMVAILQRSSTSDYHPMTMNLLLLLSQNHCHRRILAKHPGVLSSMIHFLRGHRRSTDTIPVVSQCQQPKEGDMKQQILLLAQAL